MTKWVDFKTVRENLRFPAVLSHYGIEAHGNSDQVKIICPFHDDHKPSCGVNIDKHVFNCFACDAGGNALDFIAHMEGLDPSKTTELRKAAFMAAETFGIEQALKKPVQGSKQRTTKRDPKSVQSKPAEAEKVAPAQKTKKDKPVKPSNQPLTFELKLDASHPFLADKREELGLKKKHLKELGIGFANKGMMKGRICFPIHNAKGELIAYSGRWAEGDLPKDVPRYLLPKGFEKSKVLFNLHRVIEKGSETVVIVEGFWSVLRLHAAGIPCVSTFGDSLSKAQAKQLVKHGIKSAILIYDGDEAGRTGTIASLPVLAERLFVRTIALDDGVKPDTMSNKIVKALPCF